MVVPPGLTPFEPGHLKSTKHSAWSSDVPAEARELAPELFGQDAYAKHPMIAIRATEAWLRARRAEKWLEINGDQDEHGHPRSVLAAVERWDRYLLAVATTYGMTPMSEARLAGERGDVRPGGAPSDVVADCERLLDQLEERRVKKLAAVEFRERMPKPLGSPARLALPAGDVVEVVDAELVDESRELTVTEKAIALLDELDRRRREREEHDG